MSDRPGNRRAFLQQTGCLALTLGLPRALSDLPFQPIHGHRDGSTQVYPLPDADGVHIDYDTQIILARSQQRVYAFNLSCPHENAAVKWLARDRRFQCTRHDSKYQVDGVYMAGRATRNLDRFAVKRDGQSIVVDLDRLYQSDKHPAEWAAAVVALA